MVVPECLQLKVVSVRGAAMAGDIHDQHRLFPFRVHAPNKVKQQLVTTAVDEEC